MQNMIIRCADNGVSNLLPPVRSYQGGCAIGSRKILSAIVCIILSMPALGGQNTRDQSAAMNANAVVHQMLQTYQNASSVQESSTATFAGLNGGEAAQTYRLAYQRPNLLYVSAQDPGTGTLAGYCDGKKITLFNESTQTYITRPAPPDLAGVVMTMSSMSQKLVGRGMDQSLNPISFILAQGMLREAKGFRTQGTQTINGRKAYVITGLAEQSYFRTIMPQLKANLVERTISLFIDAETHQLLKATARLKWTNSGEGRTGHGQPIGFDFRETHVDTQLNKPIPRETFVFRAPPGAKERK